MVPRQPPPVSHLRGDPRPKRRTKRGPVEWYRTAYPRAMAISPRRASELALLCAEAALRARAPDQGRPAADLVEWLAGHAQVCPELAARLPQVARLLRSSAACAEAGVAPAAPAGPPSGRVDMRVRLLVTREAAERLGLTARGTRYLAARGRLPGARRNRATGRWEIPEPSVTAWHDARRARAS